MTHSDDAPKSASAPNSLRDNPSFVRLWCVRTATTGAYQMQGVAIGWQLYEMTGNPLDLGIVGLVQFLPLVGFSPLIGQVADRYDRRVVAAICQVIRALCVLALALGTLGGWLGREAIFVLVFFAASARAFEMPGLHAHGADASCRRSSCRARSRHPRRRSRPRSSAARRSAACSISSGR